jgi:hypothetical protein
MTHDDELGTSVLGRVRQMFELLSELQIRRKQVIDP